MAKNIGYDAKELYQIFLNHLFLGQVCGTPVNFTDIKEGQVVVDIGSGGGIDVFISANKIKDSGKVFGVDMTDGMLEKARNNAKQSAFTNVEFKKGDIERRIPIEDSAVALIGFFSFIVGRGQNRFL
jgi:arsenite methyltransferase